MDHFQIRDLRQEDIKPALHLALPSAAGADHDLPARVDHFLHYLAAQDLEIDWKLGIVTQGRLVGSVLGVVSPGKVAMILISSCMPETALSDAVTQALEVLEQKAQHAGLAILQSLIPPDCADRAQVLGKAGYVFLADFVLALNDSNPQVASRMVSIFNDWRRYDSERQILMQAQLERIASSGSLSKDVYEIVSRALSR